MKTHLLIASLLLSASALVAPAPAQAKLPPCAKGALIGGAVGYLAGHHTVAGAAVGCAGAAVVHHNRHHRHHRHHR